MYLVEPMSLEYAHLISEWVYSDEYSIYSFDNDNETIAELMNGQYFSCVDSENNLVGYFCFGTSAQIPTIENDIYCEDILDIGLGLKPELCGHGLGNLFMQTGMNYSKQNLQAKKLRLFVACFNHRAIKLYEKLGFRQVTKVSHKKTNKEFFLMVCKL